MSARFYSDNNYANRIILGAGDPYFSNVVALLHMDGLNGDTAFTDSSSTPKAFAAYGNAQISTAQSKFGGEAGLFDGNGDYLEAADSADWDFGTGDFTLEAWIYTTTVAAGQGTVIARQEATNNMVLQFRRNGSDFDFIARDTGGANLLVVTASAAISANTWHHVAASRNGSTLRLFVDGVQKNSGTISNTLDCSRPLTIGVVNDTSLAGYFNGYIDDVRITKDVGRYSAGFTPPSSPFHNY